MTELILLIDDYIKDFKNTKTYQNYYKYYNKVNTNHKDSYDDMIEAKNKFDEVMKYGKFHPDFKNVSKEYQEKRINYYENEDVKLFRKYQKEVENAINNFLNELTKEISSNIPIINELGLVTNSLGGLNCGNC